MHAPAMSFMMGCITAHSFLYFSPLVAMKYLFQAHLTPISLSNTCCAILSRNLTTKSNHNQGPRGPFQGRQGWMHRHH